MRRLALLAALLLAAGCGGSAPKSYSAAADDACVHVGKQLDSLGTPAGLDGYRKWVDKALPIAEGYVEKLAKLQPPARLHAAAAAYLAFERDAVATLRRLKRIAETPAADQLAEIDRLAGMLRAKAGREAQLERALGMTECARS